MNNATIIFNESVNLMEAGIIGTTGRKMIVRFLDENGEEVEKEMMEPEEIHTFADWKSRGYFVKKGEKAIAKFPIWNYTNKAPKAEREAAAAEGKEAEADPHYYMKESCFFKLSQTSAAEKFLPAVI